MKQNRGNDIKSAGPEDQPLDRQAVFSSQSGSSRISVAVSILAVAIVLQFQNCSDVDFTPTDGGQVNKLEEGLIDPDEVIISDLVEDEAAEEIQVGDMDAVGGDDHGEHSGDEADEMRPVDGSEQIAMGRDDRGEYSDEDDGDDEDDRHDKDKENGKNHLTGNGSEQDEPKNGHSSSESELPLLLAAICDQAPRAVQAKSQKRARIKSSRNAKKESRDVVGHDQVSLTVFNYAFQVYRGQAEERAVIDEVLVKPHGKLVLCDVDVKRIQVMPNAKLLVVRGSILGRGLLMPNSQSELIASSTEGAEIVVKPNAALIRD